ncbi:unnamed protein product [Staurois parvus]|uniref:Uncharacterized protein n=1 Tax=Staurois parvus TaxID=386267 RepID=A0ABN9HIK9_9NEOB|nr:unnamed protein product [Staurois parvus]
MDPLVLGKLFPLCKSFSTFRTLIWLLSGVIPLVCDKMFALPVKALPHSEH